MGHFVRWDNLSPEKCQLNNDFLTYMPEIWPKIAQDIPKIRASFAQGMGIQIYKVGQNVAGESASVGTLCRRKVRDEVRHLSLGRFVS